MAERPVRTGEGEPKDPMQKAVDRLERQVSSPKYNRTALQRALDSLAAVGLRVGRSPGELYVTLATYSGKLAETAQAHNQPEDAASFTVQQQTFQQAGEQFTQGGQTLPTSSSKPRRTTGRAAG